MDRFLIPLNRPKGDVQNASGPQAQLSNADEKVISNDTTSLENKNNNASPEIPRKVIGSTTDSAPSAEVPKSSPEEQSRLDSFAKEAGKNGYVVAADGQTATHGYTGKSITIFDTPKVRLVRESNAGKSQTLRNITPEWVTKSEPRFAETEQHAIEKLPDGVEQGRQVVILMGLPGAGKSSISDPVIQRIKALFPEADFAKTLLPEYEGGKGAFVVHKESSVIRNEVANRAMKRGDNLVLEVVGADIDTLRETIRKYANNGYQVHIKLIDVSPGEAAKRAVKRFEDPKDGRFVDPKHILDYGYKPRENYGIIKHEEGVSSYEYYNNNVKKGQQPTLVESESSPGSDTRSLHSVREGSSGVDRGNTRGKTGTGSLGTSQEVTTPDNAATSNKTTSTGSDTSGTKAFVDPGDTTTPAKTTSKTDKPQSRREIVAGLEDMFGPIRTGRLSRKKVAGQSVAGEFHIREFVIRTKNALDLRTIAHEAAHAMHKLFDMDTANKSRDLSPDVFPKQYHDELGKLDYANEGRVEEGFAEYVRHWMTESDGAKYQGVC